VTAAAWVTMLVGMAIIWGGLLTSILVAVRRSRALGDRGPFAPDDGTPRPDL
jgi:hypothetical protein